MIRAKAQILCNSTEFAFVKILYIYIYPTIQISFQVSVQHTLWQLGVPCLVGFKKLILDLETTFEKTILQQGP